MKYKLTPLNIFVVFMIGYSFLLGGGYFSVYLILFGLLGLLIDFVIQAMSIKNVWAVLIEIIIILIFLVAFH